MKMPRADSRHGIGIRSRASRSRADSGESTASRFRFSLRSRLFLLVIIAMLPALGLVLYNGWEQRQDARAEVRSETLSLTQLAVVQQEQVLEGSRQLLGTIAILAGGSDLSAVKQETCGPVFAKLLPDFTFYSNIGVMTADGNVICSAVPLTGPVNESGNAGIQRAVAANQLSVGDYAIDPITHTQAVSVAYPIAGKNGELSGLMFVSLNPDWLDDQLAAAKLPDDATFSIIDRNGTIIAREPPSAGEAGQAISASAMALLRQGQGVANVTGLDGVTRVTAMTPIQGAVDTGLYASVGIPQSTAFSDANDRLLRNLTGLGLATILALIAAGIGAEMFVLRQTKGLMTATKRLAAGDLTARTNINKGSGEIAELARRFDEMAVLLEQRDAERRRAEQTTLALNETLEKRVQERTESVAKHAAELSRSNADLEDFTHVVSHDLKEPLRGIEAFSGFLAEDYAPKLDERGRGYVTVLQDSAVRMRDLIDDLLQLSRIGRVKPQMVTASANELVKDVTIGMGFAIGEKGAELKVQPDLPDVTCDPVRIRQVFENLIANAIKYNDKPHPMVDITCSEGPDAYTFSVRDNGPGIDPKYHDKIFRIFQRLVLREEHEGTGVGLTICKKIIEGHGGNIWVESTGSGEGSTFSFTLPRSIQPTVQSEGAQDGEQTKGSAHTPGGGQPAGRNDHEESAGQGPGEQQADSGA